MLLVLSGEGASDMGTIFAGEFKPGAMALIVDRLIELKLGFSPIAYDRAFLRTSSDLVRVAKSQQLRPPLFLPGQARERGYAIYAKLAAALSSCARDLERVEGDRAIAVLFHDSDGTQSTPARHWEFVVSAIKSGFDAMEFSLGVPMVPKPKQEAWLLCAIRTPAYQNCRELENESGNDASRNSLKRQLETAHGSKVDAAVMLEWIESNDVDVERIDMPSFNLFRDHLVSAIDQI